MIDSETLHEAADWLADTHGPDAVGLADEDLKRFIDESRWRFTDEPPPGAHIDECHPRIALVAGLCIGLHVGLEVAR